MSIEQECVTIIIVRNMCLEYVNEKKSTREQKQCVHANIMVYLVYSMRYA